MVRDYNGIVKALMGEWDKTSQPLKERATILPFGQYEDGSVGMAWPGIFAQPAESFARMADTPMPAINDDAGWAQMSRDGFDAAGLAMTGGLGAGLAGGLADNAVGSAGGNLAKRSADLPMDLASRMNRAREMGFDTEKTWYHGTDREFPAFESTRGASGAEGVYLTDNPDVASFYAQARGGENAQIVPVNIKSFGPFADYFQTADGTRNIAVPPNSIRSVNAAFDPAMSDSANLLAANAKTGAAVPLATNALERQPHQSAWENLLGARPGLSLGRVRMDDEGGMATLMKDGRSIGTVEFMLDGNTAYIDNIITKEGSNSLGVGGIRALREAFREIAPNVTRFEGSRAPGMKTGAAAGPVGEGVYRSRNQGFDYFANAPTGSAIPLVGEAQDESDPALLEVLRQYGLIQ